MLTPDQNLYLIGLMGVGKTTLGKRLARALDREFVDSDERIESTLGVSINHIFDIEGEDGFRERETCVLEKISEVPNQVVATGGGIVIQPENRRILKATGLIVYLHAPANILWSRLRYCKNRPLLQTDNPQQVLADLLEKREPLYREVADFVIHVTNNAQQKTVNRLVERLNETVSTINPDIKYPKNQ